MTSRHGQLALAVLVFSAAVLLASTQSALAADVCTNAPVAITLTYNLDGTCGQAIGATSPVKAPLVVAHGHCVTYSAKDQDGAAAAFDVKFEQGSSPFYDFTASSAGDTVTTGPVQGTPGDTYLYHAVTITHVSDNQPQYCLNGKQLGLIMK